MLINKIVQTKFLGASVSSLQSTVGFQEQSSDLMIELVEDASEGDLYSSPTKGTPLSFVCESFRFDGIVQNDSMRRSPSGYPVYSVRLGSPTAILEGTILVLDAFVGADLIMPNFLGVYGYLEKGGAAFGHSQKNESGIPWYLISGAVTAIQDGTTPYATGINFYGHKYRVRMDQLPGAPQYYRMGGVTITLMQAIQTLCQDAGYDFMITMTIAEDGVSEIGFKTRSRLIQYPLGQIEAFVRGRDDVISYDSGSEWRSDITSGVLIGGNVEELTVQQDVGNFQTIRPFWGYQDSVLLTPFGTQGNLPILQDTDPNDGNDYKVYFNASSIGDIIGDGVNLPIYPCTILEMRMAMVDFDSWSAYVVRKRTDLLTWLGIPAFPSVMGSGIPDGFIQSMFTNNIDGLSILTDVYKNKPAIKQLERIYDFVRSQAETYMGRQFLVRIPFLLQYYFESDTNKLFYNLDPTGEAYWPDYSSPLGVGPMGLNYNNFNLFSTNESKFTSFMFYGKTSDANIGSRGQTNFCYQNNGIYTSCSMEPQIIYTPAPAVVVSVNEPMWSQVTDPVGGITDMADFLGMGEDVLLDVLNRRNGEFPIHIHPYPIYPTGAAIPLRSNQKTYGPWIKLGVAGPIKVTQDAGLVPWNYGGFDLLNQAATQQLADIGSTNHIEESGSVTLAGLPLVSLGDALTQGGPTVTNIDITIDASSGLTTTYRMRSQTPVYGAFSKQNAERLRRLGTAAQDMRRNLRTLFTRANNISNTISSTTDYKPFFRTSGAIDAQNQLNVLHGFMFTDPLTGEVFPVMTNQNFKGALGASNAHNNDLFKKTASVGMESMFRPFSTNPQASGIPNLQIQKKAEGMVQAGNDSFDSGPIKIDAINPYQSGNDILWMANGSSFSGFYGKKPEIDLTDVRAVGLRGPVVIVGHGRDLLGQPVPNAVPDSGGATLIQDLSPTGYFQGDPPPDYEDEFADDTPDSGVEPSGASLSTDKVSYLRRSDMWKAGVLDAMWDKWRGVWTFPGIMIGSVVSASGVVDSGSSGIVSGVVSSGVTTSGVVKLDGYDDQFPVKNYLGGPIIKAGTTVYFGYAPLKNEWVILAASCPSG